MAPQPTLDDLAQELLNVAPQCPEGLVEARLREIARTLFEIAHRSARAAEEDHRRGQIHLIPRNGSPLDARTLS